MKNSDIYERQLAERNKAYYNMAANLTKAGLAVASERVRALALSREPEQPGAFIRALMGDEVGEDDILMLQASTDVLHVLSSNGYVTKGGKIPVIGFIKALAAASAHFERMAKDYLQLDDGQPVTDVQITGWKEEAAKLQKEAADLVEIASGPDEHVDV